MNTAMVAKEGPFDVIFCRNVLIYFDDASRLSASHNLFEALNAGGFICLGSLKVNGSDFRSPSSVRRFEDAVVY